LQSAVACHTTSVEKHLHCGSGNADVHALADKDTGYRILVPAVLDKIVARNHRDRPDGRYIGSSRQRQHIRLIFIQIGTAAASSHLLERAAVQFLQLFGDRLIQFTQGKELAVAQSSYDPRLSKADRCLCRTLVPRLADTGWY